MKWKETRKELPQDETICLILCEDPSIDDSLMMGIAIYKEHKIWHGAYEFNDGREGYYENTGRYYWNTLRDGSRIGTMNMKTGKKDSVSGSIKTKQVKAFLALADIKIPKKFTVQK